MKPDQSVLLALARINQILPPPFAWCEIPAGSTRLDDAPHAPGSKHLIERFYCARFPITNAQFLEFMRNATLDRWTFSREALRWSMAHPLTYNPDAASDEPRVDVPWYDAVAFCRWLTKLLKLQAPLQIRLPTEHEWQLAASGPDKLRYPWGNTFDAGRCNTQESGWGRLTPVSAYTSGESPFQVRGIAGNVREWCVNPRGENKGKLADTGPRAVRGGSFKLSANAATTHHRTFAPPHTQADDLGFRIVLAAFYIH